MNHWQTTLLLALLVAAVATDDLVGFNSLMPEPILDDHRVPLKNVDKLIGQNHMESFPEINFEVSSKLLMKEGELDQKNIYDESVYSESDNAQCRIYPTDMTFKSSMKKKLKKYPIHTVLLEQFDPIRGFTSFSDQTVQAFDIYKMTDRDGDEKNFMPYLETSNLIQLTPKKGSPEESDPLAKVSQLLAMNSTLYIMNHYTVYHYSIDDKQLRTVGGYEPPQASHNMRIASVGKISDKMFYIVFTDRIQIYEMISENLISLKKTYSDIPHFIPISCKYDEETKTFYISTYIELLVIQIGDLEDHPLIKSLDTNGTCTFVDKFQKTLHMACSYEKIHYIAEILVDGIDSMILNRYYSDLEVPRTTKIRKVGEDAMVLIGDDQMRVQNYGVNKQIVKNLEKNEPFFHFEFYGGLDLVPIKTKSMENLYRFVALYQHGIQVIEIKQSPPELYCEFSKEENSKNNQHNILMKFNTTHCPGATDKQDNLLGICETIIPIKITSHPHEYVAAAKSGQELFAPFIVIAVILAVVAAVWSFKRYKKVGEKVDAISRQLEKMKKRDYRKQQPI